MARTFYVGKVKGLDEVIAVLDEVRPKLHETIIEKMESEAEELANRVTAAIPNEAPMSGFGDHRGGTNWANRGGAKAKPSGLRTGAAGVEWPVYKIILTGYASAVGDIAGAGSAGKIPQGINMIAVLNARQGRASRWVWPTAERHEAKIERRMGEAADKVSEKANAKLASRAASAGG